MSSLPALKRSRLEGPNGHGRRLRKKIVVLQKCCTWGTETRQTKSACDRDAQPKRPAARSTTLLTARLPAAVAIFDVIAGNDPADPVTAASQGKRADSYLRFLDKDGARLGVVHQLFTSEDADPGAMARIGPQRERFSPPRASDRCRFGEGTFGSTHGNGQDA